VLEWAAMDSPEHRGISIPGLLGVVCIAFYWMILLVPRRVLRLDPVLEVIGPFGWLMVLGMILLPIVAAKRGSKWWFAVAAVGAITLADLLRHIH
jgi:O-antigen/teichoic acid export membrane protein